MKGGPVVNVDFHWVFCEIDAANDFACESRISQLDAYFLWRLFATFDPSALD